MKKILITGGAGFIGTNFVNYLFDHYPDYHITVLDALTYAGSLNNLSKTIIENPRFSFWHGDVRNVGIVTHLIAKSDIVVHFAAETHVARSIFDDLKFFETDVLGTQCIASTIVKNLDHIDRLIHISTSEVYGTALSNPMDENHLLHPMNPYAAAKAGADRLIYSYWQTYNIPVVTLRMFNQYGPYQHLEKVIPRFITSAILDEPLTIHGNGEAKRDWLHVADTCERIDLAMHTDKEKIVGEVFNLGSGVAYDILTIAKMILKIMRKPESLISYMPDRPGQVQHHLSSTQKAKEMLGVKQGRNFQDGLEKTIQWYSDNKQWWARLLPMKCVAISDKNGNLLYY